MDQLFRKAANLRLSEFGEEFTMDSKEYEVFYWTVLSYFTRNRKFFDSPIVKNVDEKKSFNKGLLICGGHGIGKSFLFDTLHLYFNEDLQQFGNNFANDRVQDVVEEYDLEGAKGITRFFKGQRYFDDVGSEENGSHYKTSNVFRMLLERRSSLLQIHGLKTFLTTNLGHKELLERYGNRVESRLFEMFNIIVCEGKDRRK